MRRGLTLVEVSISTLLVGLVMVGALRSVGMVIRTWQVADADLLGLTLARDLMGEIGQQRYEESGSLGRELPESGLDRALWDDVDDYHGWNASPPQEKGGNNWSGYTGWRRTVSVEYLNLASPQNTSVSDQGLKRITVTVTDPGGRQTILVGYRSRWGALEAAPPANTTILTNVECQLDVGPNPKLRGGTNLVNHPEDQ